MTVFIISFFFISPLHVWRRCLPYIIKDDSGEKDSEDFKTA